MIARKVAFAEQYVIIQHPPELTTLIDFLFADIPQNSSGTLRQIFKIAHFKTDQWTLQGQTGLSEVELANQLMAQSIQALIYNISKGIILHAAAVAKQGKTIWIPGVSGAGKSTLTAWLLSQGFDYLTDELIYLPIDKGAIEFFTRPLPIKNMDPLNSLLNFNDNTKKYVKNNRLSLLPYHLFGVNRPVSDQKLSLILFPVFQSGAKLSIQALSAAQLGLHLMTCHVNARNLPAHGFPNISQLARQVSGCHMVYGHFKQLNGILDELNKATLQGNVNNNRKKHVCSNLE
ncbi:MAG: hypothetical protein KAH77_10095 [Thiomargarita sp.]|nr:hypothetical protein [Thiomargarita sp.]